MVKKLQCLVVNYNRYIQMKRLKKCLNERCVKKLTRCTKQILIVLLIYILAATQNRRSMSPSTLSILWRKSLDKLKLFQRFLTGMRIGARDGQESSLTMLSMLRCDQAKANIFHAIFILHHWLLKTLAENTHQWGKDHCSAILQFSKTGFDQKENMFLYVLTQLNPNL